MRLLAFFLGVVIAWEDHRAEKPKGMSHQKILEGQIAALSVGRAD